MKFETFFIIEKIVVFFILNMYLIRGFLKMEATDKLKFFN